MIRQGKTSRAEFHTFAVFFQVNKSIKYEEPYMWYCASLLFKAIRKGCTEDEPTWQESLRIIEALSEQEAILKARNIGKEEEHDYVAADGHRVNWSFEYFSISQAPSEMIKNGTEIFYRFLRDRDIGCLLRPPFVDPDKSRMDYLTGKASQSGRGDDVEHAD
jgi:hypothetical protein